MVNIWNRLPEKVVLSSSVNCFKGRFDSFFGDNCYETDLEQILSNAFATKFDNFKDFDEEYLEEDTFPDRSTGIWPIATEYDDDNDDDVPYSTPSLYLHGDAGLGLVKCLTSYLASGKL